MTGAGGISGDSPTAQEAAAIVVAVERFLRDHAPPQPAAAAPPDDAWRAAALLEGVRGGFSAVSEPHPWINT
jgi:hypothetical protein